MKKYLSKVNMVYAAKNKLHKAIINYIKSIDRQLVPVTELGVYKLNVINAIKNLVIDHPKCAPIKPSWWENEGDYHLSLGGQTIINFTLYQGEEII
jgi:hypothetical protein